MSANNSTPGGQPSAAVDVTFSSLADRYGHGHGLSSSRAESASSGYRSSNEQRRSRQEAMTVPEAPPRQDNLEYNDSVPARPNRSSGGFLLDSSFGNSSPREDGTTNRHGKRKAQDGHLYVGKTRHGDNRLSVDSSLRGSPLSRQVSMDHGEARRAQRPPSMDPAQLVQMALDLSESRKRHTSGPIQLPITSPRSKRGASGLNPNFGTVRSTSGTGQRASYEQPIFRTSITNDGADNRLSDVSDDAQAYVSSTVTQSLSPATQSRVEKARRYFELANEHWRLLEQLPPLKPDSSAPGNFTFVSTSSPHSAHAQISRVASHTDDKHQLGRAYNPLQSLRNRRLRTRERRQLTAPPEVWQDAEAIKEWVDDVEAATQDPTYRIASDRVQLPLYVGDQGTTVDASAAPRHHRRTDTAGSIITRPENGWSIEPCELLADTYWTEKDDNKAYIENRLGNNIFPAASTSAVKKPRRSVEVTRKSQEVARNGSFVDIGASDVPSNKREQKRKHLLPRPHKLLTRSASASSASSAEGRTPSHLSHGDAGVENTGPLERHMQQMIAKDQMGELSSPDLVSPDHWESQYTPFPVAREPEGRSRSGTVKRDETRNRSDALKRGDARLSVDTQHRRAKSADGRVGGNRDAMSSGGHTDSDDPYSPAKADPAASTSNATTYPPLDQPPERKSKLHKLPIFRNHSKEQNNIERTDFATVNENRLSIDQPRSSQESARPSFISRHKTAESFSSSLRRQGTTATTDTSGKESGSGVGRFLKGGRIGDLVRNEGSRLSDRLRSKDRPESDDVGDLFDEPESDDELDARPALGIDNGDEPSPRTSIDQARPKSKYFLSNLPTFKSSVGRGKQTPVQTPLSTGSDPIGQQQRAQKEAGRSSRFDRLAPPRINLPDDDNASVPEDVTNKPYIDVDDRRKSYGFLGNGSKVISRASVVSYDPNQPVGRTSSQHVGAYGRRHWSISDRLQPQQQSNKVTRRDIARVRALLLASGVKAREIQQQADSARETALPVVQKAAKLVGQDLGSPTRKDELMVAARMLSSHLDSSFADHEQFINTFHSNTAKGLASQLGELQRRAVEELTKLLHETSDEADAFTVELTTKGPQDVKRVDDGIDDLLRQRRRQFRLLRRAGFKLLEWLVLGIMWWVWFVVVMINLVKRSVLGALRFLRWLFWF